MESDGTSQSLIARWFIPSPESIMFAAVITALVLMPLIQVLGCVRKVLNRGR